MSSFFARAASITKKVQEYVETKRNEHPYHESLLKGVPVTDLAFIQRAYLALRFSSIIYEASHPEPTFTLELKDASSVEVETINFTQAQDGNYFDDNSLVCSNCATPFLVSQNMKAAFKREAVRRHHCRMCFQSVCGECSTMVDGKRICLNCKENPPPPKDSEVQYGVFAVASLRLLVITFRGTHSRTDMAIDGMTRPRNLFENLPAAPVSQELYVHGGVLKQIQQQGPRVERTLCNMCARPEFADYSIVITGHSLGGGYASVLALWLLAASERMRSILLARNMRLFTFGSPRILFTSPGMTGALSGLTPPGEPFPEFFVQRFHHFVSGTDIVPRILGSRMTGQDHLGGIVRYLGHKFAALRVEKDDMGSKLHLYQSLGSVYALTEDNQVLFMPFSVVSDYLTLYLYSGRQVVNDHSIAAHEQRMVSMEAAIVKGSLNDKPLVAAPVTGLIAFCLEKERNLLTDIDEARLNESREVLGMPILPQPPASLQRSSSSAGRPSRPPPPRPPPPSAAAPSAPPLPYDQGPSAPPL